MFSVWISACCALATLSLKLQHSQTPSTAVDVFMTIYGLLTSIFSAIGDALLTIGSFCYVMKCIPTKKDFGLIIMTQMFFSMTGQVLFNWLLIKELMSMLAINIILYIIMVIQLISAAIIHYAIPIPNFSVNERTIDEVGIEFKVKWLPKWV